MKRTLSQVIEEYNLENGYEPNDDNNDYEYFIEILSQGVVQEEISSQHRWYDIHSVVHKVTIDQEERYFKTFAYHTTGDLCASDMNLDMPTIHDVVEVYPHKVVKTVHY